MYEINTHCKDCKFAIPLQYILGIKIIHIGIDEGAYCTRNRTKLGYECSHVVCDPEEYCTWYEEKELE